MRGEFFDVDGARLYGYAAGQRGDGATVVLLHGVPTSSHLWSGVVPLLPDGHRVLVLDLLGFGRSDRPGRRALTLAAHAARVLAVLDQLGVDRACLVGHELGAALALHLAVHHPPRVSHLALASAAVPGAWPSRELRLARRLLPLTRRLPADWILGLLRRDLLRGYAAPDRGTHSVDMYLRPFAGPAGRDVLAAHLAALDGAGVAALARRLGEVAVPTAVLRGAEDPFLAPEAAERLHRALPGSTLHVLADVRHFVPEEAPEQVAAAVSDLLTR